MTGPFANLRGCKATVEWQLAGKPHSTWRRTCQMAYFQHTTSRKISNCELRTLWIEADRRVPHTYRHSEGFKVIRKMISVTAQTVHMQYDYAVLYCTVLCLSWLQLFHSTFTVWNSPITCWPCRYHQYLLVLKVNTCWSWRYLQYLLIVKVPPILVGPVCNPSTCWPCRYPQYLFAQILTPVPVGPAGTPSTCWSWRYPQYHFVLKIPPIPVRRVVPSVSF
jgi:hypothetical protein